MGYQQVIADEESPTRFKLTVRDFLLLDKAGVFPTKHTELVDGEIYVLSPIHRPHARAQSVLVFAFHDAVMKAGLPFDVLAPVSTYMDEHNLPEPDLVLADRVPLARAQMTEEEDFVALESARLVVEVAHSSLRSDLGRKLALYARKGISEYWVVDTKGRKLHRLSRPVGEVYELREELPLGGLISLATIPDLSVDLSSLEEA